MKITFIKNKNKDIVKKSSSGGVFSVLAEYVIQNKGVVFGAVFDKDFSVIIDFTEKDFQPMLGSKYVQSSTGNSFKKCKEFLDNGRLVLYSGTPCQIIGLKSFLKKNYENLITVDVICHGSPVKEVWQHYLKSFGKEIESVNFRDKCIGTWGQYHLSIKFKDGTVFSENHNDNKYFKLFLENKILKESCYSCKCCKNSRADLTLGDAWGCNAKNDELRTDEGTSCVIVNTVKGETLLEKLNDNFVSEETTLSYLEGNSVGYVHNYEKPKDREKIIEGILKPRIAMVTIPGHNNVGNTLQAFALQAKVKELLPSASITLINDFDLKHNKLDFYKNNVKSINEGFVEEKYDMMIVGSDQIWGSAIERDWKIPNADRFIIRNVKKLFYAPSFGFAQTKYNDAVKTKVSDALRNCKYVSSRETFGTYMCNKMFNVNCADVLDPTLLHDALFYCNAVGEKLVEKNEGIFAYILDKSEKTSEFIKTLSEKTKQPILEYDGTVESFIRNMNKCKYVLTDSYHGTVFSIIFRKSFLTYKNGIRGNMRFDDLELKFGLTERMMTAYDLSKIGCLEKSLDVNYVKLKNASLDFLRNGLYQI